MFHVRQLRPSDPTTGGSPLDEHGSLLRMGYVVLSAVAGAFTALGFAKWRDMSGTEVALTLVGGFSFAIFVTPWIATGWLGVAEGDTRSLAALTYVFGSGSNILLPAIIRSLKGLADRLFGTGGVA